MGNILRMDFYRLVRSKSLWIMLAIMVVCAAITMGTVAYMLSPGFAEAMQNAGNAAANTGLRIGVSTPTGSSTDLTQLGQEAAQMQAVFSGLTPMALVGQVFINGGALATIFVIFIAIFFAAEFENGFAKNTFTAQPNRGAVLGARVIEIVLLAALFVLVCAASILAGAALAGIETVSAPVGDMALWFALVVLVLAAFGMLTALVSWLTRKMAAGIVAGIVAATGMVVAIIGALLSLFPAVSHLTDFTLYSCISSLALGVNIDGGLSAVHIACIGLVFLAIYAVLSFIVLKKKDV